MRRLLRSMAVVANRGATRRPVMLPADGWHEGLPSGEAARSQAVRYASVAQSAACLCVPAAAGPPSAGSARIRPAASGWSIQGREGRLRVDSRRPVGSTGLTAPNFKLPLFGLLADSRNWALPTFFRR